MASDRTTPWTVTVAPLAGAFVAHVRFDGLYLHSTRMRRLQADALAEGWACVDMIERASAGGRRG